MCQYHSPDGADSCCITSNKSITCLHSATCFRVKSEQFSACFRVARVCQRQLTQLGFLVANNITINKLAARSDMTSSKACLFFCSLCLHSHELNEWAKATHRSPVAIISHRPITRTADPKTIAVCQSGTLWPTRPRSTGRGGRFAGQLNESHTALWLVDAIYVLGHDDLLL